MSDEKITYEDKSSENQEKTTPNNTNQQSISNNSDVTKKPKSTTTILLVIIAILVTFLITSIAVGGGIYLWLNYDSAGQSTEITSKKDHDKQTTDKTEQKDDNSSDKKTPDKTDNDKNKDDNKDNQSDNTNKQPTLTSIDNTWNLYTNYKHGFSIKIPKKVYEYSGSSCNWDGESYRPVGGIVPFKVFEDEHVLFAGEYYYKLGGETIQDYVSYFSECNRVDTNLAIINSDDYWQSHWELVFADAADDAQLETFIKNRYGAGCDLGDKTATGQSGVFDVVVKGDNLPLDQTACPINYVTTIKYNSNTGKVISWHMGQAINFYGDENYTEFYDSDMADSFKFLD